MHLRIVIAAIATVLMIAGAHAQEGARAYYPRPAGTNDLEGTLTIIHSEIAGSMFDSPVFTPSYRRALDLNGDAATFLIGLPIGNVSAALDTPIGTVKMDTDPAQGDLFIGGTLGLVNAPALTPMEYAQYKPGFSASVVGRVFFPTGDYDSSRLLNLGGNRFSFEAMLPMSFILGESLIDPNVTTFELIPGIQIFTDNDDPYGPGSVMSQDPLFTVEGHITHSFGNVVWASLDAYSKFGGETSTDGVKNDDDQATVGLGATLGLTLSQSLALRLSYQQQVYSKTPHTDSHTFMATAAFLF